MTTKELLKRTLPKWPAFVVKGKKVTKDQAKEIIIRTGALSFSTNDHRFEKELLKACGFTAKSDWEVQAEERAVLAKEIRLLELDYLQNDRVASCWIGGPKGWCNWEGDIGCSNFNIGKWPSCKEVYEEWKIVAEAFPFLHLKNILFNGETSEDNIKPVIEFRVKDGTVKVCEPEEDTLDLPTSSIEQALMTIGNANRERGCTIETFKDALEFVKGKYGVANKTW